jgi:hypothetical protein
MKVWVVVDEVDYEGGTVFGVFSSEELADAYAKKNVYPNCKYRHFEVHEFELDVGVLPYWVEK